MRRTVTLPLAVVAGAALAGCGVGVVDEPRTFATASALAERIGCTAFEADTSDQELVQDAGSCLLDGTSIDVHVFSANDLRDQWLDVATEAGGPATFVTGDRWTVRAMTLAAAEKAAEAANGDVDY